MLLAKQIDTLESQVPATPTATSITAEQDKAIDKIYTDILTTLPDNADPLARDTILSNHLRSYIRDHYILQEQYRLQQSSLDRQRKQTSILEKLSKELETKNKSLTVSNLQMR